MIEIIRKLRRSWSPMAGGVKGFLEEVGYVGGLEQD